MSEVIILPNDDDSEQLRKQLKERVAVNRMIKDPRQRAFDEFRRAGLDSETAAALSDLGSMDTASQAQTILEMAKSEMSQPTHEIQYTIARDVPGAFRNVFSATGGALGSAVGVGILQAAVRNAQSVIFVGVTIAGVSTAVLAGKFVAATLGKVAAAITAANLLSATGFIVAAILKRRP